MVGVLLTLRDRVATNRAMDTVLIILLANDAKLGSTAAVFPAVSRPDSANLRTKPHVIGY